MSTYATLQLNRFYLVIDKQSDEIVLIQPRMETSKCVLITHHIDGKEYNFWRKKKDNMYELIDEFTDEQLDEYMNLTNEDDDDFDGPFGYWDEDDDWEDDENDEN
ncbi:MAG: hypothetical protein LBE82_12385 [Chitinophagaceae bacterium]|jgi:hypothetical protein|nr:hypothetical protein [Chitinophagaceae bacterium]